jgi:antitoxin component YwqK of YwqJK toxin-antitoxin module
LRHFESDPIQLKFMKYLTALFFVVSLFLRLEAQKKGTTIYENLTTKKTYSVSLSSSQRGGYVSYKVDGVSVKKEVYQKYQNGFDSMDACCPCILKTYDKNEVLIREAIQCSDCVVGYLKEFYPNGKVKLLAYYKENPTGDWSNIFRRGYCYVEDGTWLYYNENGEIVSIEIWKDGDFIEQKPQGKKPEAWRIELLVNGELPMDNKIYMDELEGFEIAISYKNENKYSNLKAMVSVGRLGQKKQSFEMALADINAASIEQMVKSVGPKADERLSMDISILAGAEKLQTWYLEVIAE